MSLATCTISGTLFEADGSPAANAMVRVRLAHAPGESGVRIAGVPVDATARTVYTDADGVFSVALPQGALSYWEVPCAAIWGAFATVPAAASAAFASLSLEGER